MSVTSVVTKYASRRATSEIGPRSEYTVELIITCSSTSDDESTIYAATSAGIPEQYEDYAGDTAAKCYRLDLEHLENTPDGRAIWKGTAQYKTHFDDQEQGQNITNPLSRPVVYTRTKQFFEETRFRDLDGNTFTNSAGDFLDPPPVFLIPHLVLTAQKNVSSFSDGWASYYVNAINADTYRGIPPGYLRCMGIDAQGPNYENTYTYYTMTVELHYNPYGWDPVRILDQGGRYYKDDVDLLSDTLTVATDSGTETTMTVLLDGVGQRLTNANLKAGIPPHFMEYKMYRKVAFSGLGV